MILPPVDRGEHGKAGVEVGVSGAFVFVEAYSDDYAHCRFLTPDQADALGHALQLAATEARLVAICDAAAAMGGV